MKPFTSSIAAAFVAVLSPSLSAQTDPFCAQLDQAMAATKGEARTAENVANILSDLSPSPAACSFSLDLSGSTSANCNWAFSYRSDKATAEFEAMLATLTTCADPAFAMVTDQSVNHPDFYDLRMMRIAGGEVGLSIKDKIGLNKTYLFLRLTPAL